MTDEEIRTLSGEAGNEGNALLMAKCSLALGNENYRDIDWLIVETSFSPAERDELVALTVLTAREACAAEWLIRHPIT